MRPQQLSPNDRIVWNDGKAERDVIVIHNDPDKQELTVLDTGARCTRTINYSHVGFFGTVEEYLRHELEEERRKVDWLLQHCSPSVEDPDVGAMAVASRDQLAYVMSRTAAPAAT